MKQIESIIETFSNKYRWHYECQKETSKNPQEDINSGLCDLFAYELKKHFPSAIIHYDEDKDHYFCEIDGRFYDAENPRGVARKEEMIFLGQMEGALNDP